MATMRTALAILLSITYNALAAPQIAVTQWPPAPAASRPAPSLCGVLLETPACPAGFTCEPIPGTPYCDSIPDDICGQCVSEDSPSSSSTASPVVTPPPPTSSKGQPTSTCSSGSALDYRNFCRATSHSSLACPSGFIMDASHYCHPASTTHTNSSSSKFSCPSGFTPDYRGYSYCRPWHPITTPVHLPSVPVPAVPSVSASSTGTSSAAVSTSTCVGAGTKCPGDKGGGGSPGKGGGGRPGRPEDSTSLTVVSSTGSVAGSFTTSSTAVR